MQMAIKHITLGINNNTHNVNNETSNDESTHFNNAPAYICACVHTVIRLHLRAGFMKIKEKEKE